MSEDQPGMALLREGARELGLDLTVAEVACFETFARELVDWNQRMNLTAIVAPEEIQTRHFLDSLTTLAALPEKFRNGSTPAKLIDVGTGAGFPGIPLAIVRPNLKVALNDATQKKCRFLEHVVAALQIPNAEVVCGRSEELAQRPDQRERYDVAVARAVAPLATLVELCLPFVRVGGWLIAPKKLGIESEVVGGVRAVKTLGGILRPAVTVRVPVLNEERQLLVVEKVKPTPKSYPRRPGTPAKAPL